METYLYQSASLMRVGNEIPFACVVVKLVAYNMVYAKLLSPGT